MTLLVRAAVFLAGLALAAGTIFSAVETFVLPRSAPDKLARIVFVSIRRLFDLRLHGEMSYAVRDQVMAFYAPFALLGLLPFWLSLVALGYAGMYWATGLSDPRAALQMSGSALLSLGLVAPKGWPQTMLVFTEDTLGLILVAMLIAYLPTMYAAFSKREAAVTLLEVRAGSPPSAVEMLARFHRIHGLQALGEVWATWEAWFAEIEESHTSLPSLVFFRSPRAEHSWVTAAGTVLNTAALTLAAIDTPHDPRADLCIRAGYLALRHIAEFFGIRYNPNPHYPEEPISITRPEFDEAWDELARRGLPMKADREQGWQDFAGWRVNYDRVLLRLASLTMAPYSPWTSDRDVLERLPPNQFQ